MTSALSIRTESSHSIKRNISSAVNEKDESDSKKIQIYQVLYALFLVHGIGYNFKFKTLRKDTSSVAMFVFSNIVAIACDICVLHYLVFNVLLLIGSEAKDEVSSMKFQLVLGLTAVLNTLLRFLMNFHRTEMLNIFDTLNDLEKSFELDIPLKKMKLRKIIAFGLLFASTIAIVAVDVYKAKNMNLLQKLQFFVWLKCVCDIPTLLTVYFCYVCMIFKNVLLKHIATLNPTKVPNVGEVLKKHNELVDAAGEVEGKLQNTLFVFFITSIIDAFVYTYCQIFQKIHLPRVNILFAVFCTSRLILIGSSGSLVSETAEEITVAVDHMSLDTKASTKVLRFMATLRNRPIGLNLFGSIAIDKSLILSIAGSLVSYGIAIATFEKVCRTLYDQGFNQLQLDLITKIFSVVSCIKVFILIYSASMVTDSDEKCKVAVIHLRRKTKSPIKLLRLLGTVKSTRIGFNILGSIHITRSLLLSIVGSLVSYGIAIATFHNVCENPSSSS